MHASIIADPSGEVIEDTFNTNATARKALDRLDRQNAIPDRPKRNKKALRGKPDHKAKKYRRKEKRRAALAARQERQMNVRSSKTQAGFGVPLS
ncbi:hypothetical protein GR212_11170 [Rhizobium lusitanum]|uniref:Uncharacterized protein n=1 Tax=Rhizobium lusitanum TaxID=293958 RepID=A0A6L9U2T3_9HYPH|nr:hypothetical protein [Rhizobium lusitanum]NEI70133.1 hypothetical protein [Rhizobium lusitanum]